MGAMAGKKGTPGRPLKLTPDLIDRLANMLRVGTYPEVAAAACGVSREHFVMWLKKGANSKRPSIYTALISAIDKSIAEFEMGSLANLHRAGSGVQAQIAKDKDGQVLRDGKGDPIVLVPGVKPDWRADAWRLERRMHHRWAQRQKLELTGQDGQPLNQLTDQQLDDQAQKIMARLQGRSRGSDKP